MVLVMILKGGWSGLKEGRALCQAEPLLKSLWDITGWLYLHSGPLE